MKNIKIITSTILLLFNISVFGGVTLDSWNKSHEELYTRLRLQPPPLPIDKLEGKDQLTAKVFTHGYICGWDVGIKTGESTASFVVPNIIVNDAKLRIIWTEAFYMGIKKGIEARSRVTR